MEGQFPIMVGLSMYNPWGGSPYLKLFVVFVSLQKTTELLDSNPSVLSSAVGKTAVVQVHAIHFTFTEADFRMFQMKTVVT